MVDLMFIQLGNQNKSLAFLVSLVYPLGISLIDYVARRSLKTVYLAVRSQIGRLRAFNHTVGCIDVDGEGAFKSLSTYLNLNGIKVEPRSPGVHVHRVERFIRTAKNAVRSLRAGLPFLLCRSLLILAVLVVASRLNWLPIKALNGVSGHEWLTGRMLDWRRDCLDMPFGQYHEITVRETKNDMSFRTLTGLFVRATGNKDGAALFWNVDTLLFLCLLILSSV